MKEVLHRLLRKEWSGIAADGRKVGTVFWCEIDRRDIGSTYSRVVQVVVALSNAGGLGKEMWANLTGGNNVTNFALELAAALSGEVARLYYVQAENPTAEKCVRFTAEKDYWVELPVMPLALSRVSVGILDLLQTGPMILNEIYSRLQNHTDYGGLIWNVSMSALLDTYLSPMWKQGLVVSGTEKTGPYQIGPQWELVRPYQELLEKARLNTATLEQLAQEMPWLEQEEIHFQ